MAQTARLYQRRAATDALPAAVDALAAALDYLYFEAEETIELIPYAPPDPVWLHGRAFGPTLEVRWDQVDEGFELFLLTETTPDLPAEWTLVSDAFVGQSSQILLWGTHIDYLEQPHHLAGETGRAWIETRLPRPLDYPVSGGPRWVKANVVIYYRHSRPVVTRLATLEGETNEPQPLW